MSATRAVTVRLDARDFDELSKEAERLGIQPGTLARTLIRIGLNDERESVSQKLWRERRAVLDDLADFRATLPNQGPLDIAALIREGRDELDRRTPV
jgi:hypothetical protein